MGALKDKEKSPKITAMVTFMKKYRSLSQDPCPLLAVLGGRTTGGGSPFPFLIPSSHENTPILKRGIGSKMGHLGDAGEKT